MRARGGASAGRSETLVAEGEQQGLFSVEPFTEASSAIWEQREHVVLGVSPGNSYFNVARLTDLLGWLSHEVTRIDVVIPDSALEHTYLALGYEPRQAQKKARGEINVLYNRVTRAWESRGGPRATDGLHRMSDLVSHEAYRRTLVECEQALQDDRALWETCAEMSKEVLTGHRYDGPFTTERIELAMRYLIAELPFFLASADIFDAPSSLNFYHRQLPLAEFIFAGKSQLQASPRQGYATIRPAR